MAVSRGRISTLDISTDGSTYNPIEHIVDATLTVESSDIVVSDHDSGAWEEMLQGRNKASIDVKCNYDEASTEQAAAITGFFNQTVFYFRFRPLGTSSGKKQYIAQGYIASCPVSTPNDAQSEVNFKIQLTSTLTPSAQ